MKPTKPPFRLASARKPVRLRVENLEDRSVPAAAITATKTYTLDDPTANPGETIHYTVTVANTGDATATGVTFDDTFDPNAPYVSGTLKASPKAAAHAYPAAGNTQLSRPAGTLLAGAVDVDGRTADNLLTVVAETVATTQGGSVAIAADGSFTYTPQTGDENVVDKFTYQVKDGDNLIGTATVSINLGEVVWYVDSAASGAEDGSSAKPYNSLADVSGAGGGDQDGDIIFIKERAGDYDGNLTLRTGQRLYGGGADLVVNGVTINTAGSNTTWVTSAASTDALTLGSGNTVKGFTIGNTTGVKIKGSAVGAATFGNLTLQGSGPALNINGGTLAGTIDSLSAATHSNAVLLQNLAGALSINGGAIDGNNNSDDFVVLGGNAVISYSGSITNDDANSVNIQNRTGGSVTLSGDITDTGLGFILNNNSGGTITFSGASKSLTTLNNPAVQLTGNTGATINFTGGGLAITTTSGAGFGATGGGTVNVTGGGNTVNTTTGQILAWNNVNIGASGVTFATLAASGTVAADAVSLTSVGGPGNTFDGGAVTVAGTSGGFTSDGIGINSSAATFQFASATIDNASGHAINFTGGNGPVTFTTVDLDGMAAEGINIVNNTNSVTVNGGSIGATNDAGDRGVQVQGGSGDVSIAAAITSNTGNGVFSGTLRTGGTVTLSGNLNQNNAGIAINVGSNTGGTFNFSGPSKTFTNSGGTAVNFTTNTGATINFTGGGLAITSTSAGAGFGATGGGTVNVTGSGNTITSTTGTALNVANTTIGASGLTFQSISAGNNTAAADPVNGIVLNTTGSTGGLTVTGDGGAANNGSGGTIQNTTGAGISLTSVGPISLGYMNVTNSGTDGIKGTGITGGFTLNRSNVMDAPTGGATDDGVDLANVSGAVTFTNDLVDKSPHNNVVVDNNNTNMSSFTMTGTTLSNDATSNPPQNDGLLLTMRGNSVLTGGNIQNNTFSGHRAVGVQIQTNDSGRIGVNSGTVTVTALTTANSITVQNNTFTSNGQGVDIDASQISNLTFQVLNNSIVGKVTSPNAVSNQSSATAINVITAAGADTGPTSHAFVGKIDTNTIGTQGVKDSGSGFGNGIRAVIQGVATQAAITINNNTIREVPNATLINLFAQNGAATTGFGSARFKVTNNTMPQPTGSNLGLGGPANTPIADTGIFMLADEDGIGTALITGNTIYDVSVFSGSFDVYLAQRDGPPANSQLRIEGTTSVSSYILANNTLTGGSKFIDEGAGSGNPSTLVAIASAGAYPLFFDPFGGVAVAPEEHSATVAIADADPTSTDLNVTPGVTNTPTNPTLADDEPSAVPSPLIPANSVAPIPTQDDPNAIVAAAIDRWAAAGLSAEQVAFLHTVTVEFADLSGWNLGAATAGHVTLDSDAAGQGWFVDPTPLADEEFSAVSGTRLGNGPAGKLDLLTTVMHELGHQLGLDDSYSAADRDSLMYGYLVLGERRLPGTGQAAGAAPHLAAGDVDFIFAPAIGDLDAGSAVTYTFDALIAAAPLAAGVEGVSNQGTVTYNTSLTKLTDDPAVGGAADPTATPVFAQPDLTVTGSDSPDPVRPGQTLTYTLTYGNAAGATQDAAGVVLTATLANNSTFNAGASAAGWVAQGGGVYKLTVGALAAGATGSAAFAVTVDAATPTNVTLIDDFTVTIASDDPQGDAAAADNTIKIDTTVQHNVVPTVTLTAAAQSYTENAAPVPVDDSAAVADPEDNFNGGKLTVQITTGATAADRLQLLAGSAVTLTGNDVYVGGTKVGTATGGLSVTAGNALIVNFVAPATHLDVQAVLRAVHYDYTGDAPAAGTTAAKTVSVTVADDVDPGLTQTRTVNLLGVNDAPVLTGDATLLAVAEDTANPPGATLDSLFTGLGFAFSDPDTGSSLAGFAIVGNTAAAADGAWEYSSDGGATWAAVGDVADDATALAVAKGSKVRFTPAADFFGSPADLVVRALDDSYAGGFSATAGAESRVTVDTTTPGTTTAIAAATNTVSTSVTAVADAPVISPVTTAEDTLSGVITITRNGADGAEVTHVKVGAYVNGTLYSADGLTLIPSGTVLALDGAGEVTVTFLPDTDLNSPGTTFSFSAQGATTAGGGGLSVAAVGAVTVTDVNDPPTAVDDTLSAVAEDSGPRTILAGDLTINDSRGGSSDEAGQALMIADVAAVAGGSVSLTAGGDVLFTPFADFHGIASFNYSVRDDGKSNGIDDPKTGAVRGTVTFNVTSVNDAPAGADNAVTTPEDTDYVFTAADFGFTDTHDTPADALLNVKITTLPAAGALTNNGAPVAAGDAVTAEDIAAGRLVFTPDADEFGSPYATFTFQVQDDGGGADTDPTARLMTVNVTSVNDAPAGADATVTTAEDTPYVFAAADFGFSDTHDAPANALLAVKIGELPGAGTLTLSGVPVAAGDAVPAEDIAAGRLVFTPAADEFGAPYATFTFQVQDAGGGADTDPAADTITVDVTSVNDAPAGADAAVTTPEDTAYVFAAADFGFTDTHDTPPDDLLTVKIVTLPAAGALKLGLANVTAGQVIPAGSVGSLSFQPAADANGAAYATFTFQVRDAGGGADTDPTPNTITVDVTGVNDAPSGADKTVTTPEGTDYVFAAADFGFSDTHDTPPDDLSAVVIATLPAAGTLMLGAAAVTAGQPVSAADIGAGLLRFVPAADANGSLYATFTFQVQDDGGGADTDPTARTMTFTVTEVNDQPTATDDTLLDVAEDSGLRTIPFADLTGNDSAGPANESAQTKTVTLVGAAVGGNVSIVGTDVKFLPTANFTGVASFDYTVTDNGTTAGMADPKSDTGHVTFNVTAVADTPGVTDATTAVNTQTPADNTSLVVSRNAADGAEVGFFQVSNITNGALFQADGTTPIADGDFITYAEGHAGLRFTPAADTANPGTAYSFDVQAATTADIGGVAGGVATATITVGDPTAPDTALTGTPPAYDDAGATFTFTGTDNIVPAVLTFQYKLDAGPFLAAASPMTLGSLPDGAHHYEVRAVDEAGNIDPTPAAFDWVVDTVAPAVAVGAPSQLFANGAATVTYTVTYTDANPLSFSLDPTDITVNAAPGAGATVASVAQSMADPNVWVVTLTAVTGNGAVGITVKAKTAADGAGHDAPASAASATFTADTLKPTVTIGAPKTTTGHLVTTTKAGPVTFKVTAADANLTPFTLTPGQVTFVSVTGTLTADIAVTHAAADPATVWTVTVKNIRGGKGSFLIRLPAGAAADKAGNVSDAPPDSAAVAVTGIRRMTVAVKYPTVVTRGAHVRYGISYYNAGTQQTDGVSLTATLPEGATFDAAHSTAGWTDIGGRKYRLTVPLPVAARGRGTAYFAVVMPTTIPQSRRETLTAAVYDTLSGEKPLATRTVTSTYGRYA